MSTETLDNKQKKQAFDTTVDALDFAESIADSIRQGLKDAPQVIDEAESEGLEADFTGDGVSVDELQDSQTERFNVQSYGLDNIELRNEVVQEKRRAIRVESTEDRDILSDAIQRRLEQSVFGEAKIHDGFHIVNVMQECLKSEDILAYMKKAGCCTCERCQADVLAATLSHLPAMYVVMYKKSTSARISFYHENYKMDILSSIMRAIRDVNEHPHHGHDRIQ